MRSRQPQPDRRNRSHRTILVIVAAVCALVIGTGTAVLSTASETASAAAADSAPNPRPTVAAKGASRAVPVLPRVGIRTFRAPTGIRVASNIQYASAGGTALRLDVCSPHVASLTPQPAVISIHGGSWSHGDKANTDWHNVCEWLASEGFVTYSVDYRLVPGAHFPAAIDDVTQALSWVREPANVEHYNIDPKRIGVFGGSAGGNLAALLGMRGHGDTHTGTRVAAVAELSGPVDLTAQGQTLGHPDQRLQQIELAYLNCTSFESCAAAKDASAVSFVDSTDPPVFIGASKDEFVPVEQDSAFAAALQKAGVPHTMQLASGHWHSIATLDAGMRTAVAAFLHRYLG